MSEFFSPVYKASSAGDGVVVISARKSPASPFACRIASSDEVIPPENAVGVLADMCTKAKMSAADSVSATAAVVIIAV